MALLPHEQRVVNEHIELTDKLGKLITFIETSPIYNELEEVDAYLLVRQARVMHEYSEILATRIQRLIKEAYDYY